MKNKNIWETAAIVIERGMDFDVSDTPQEPSPVKRKGPPPVPVRRNPTQANARHAYNPGMPPERRKDEAPVGLAPASQADMQARRTRANRPTMPLIPAATGARPPQGGAAPGGFEVSTPTGDVFRVDASSPDEAKQLVIDMMADEQARTGHGGAQIDVNRLKVRPAQSTGEAMLPDVSRGRVSVQNGKLAGANGVHPSRLPTSHSNPYGGPKARPMAQSRNGSPEELGEGGTCGSSGAGFQMPIGDAAEAAERVYYKEALHQVFRETVRKLPNGKYGVYTKNKGKKKAPKKVGEYPDRVAAREAELARGGKSGDSAKKERDKLNKLKKDPKKLAAAKRKDSSKKARATKESIIGAMVDGLNEALFREDDVPGSTWDERLAGLSPTALASNKKLAGHTRNIGKASASALMDAHKLLAKALKKHGKVHAGEIGTETGGKMYMPCMLQHKDGDEHGPMYLYVDGGHVKMEMDDEMNESMDGMDEGEGHKLRGALQAFQEKQLPRIDTARSAVTKRDADLDRMEKEHDEELSGRDGVSLHLLKTLIGQKHGRRFR